MDHWVGLTLAHVSFLEVLLVDLLLTMLGNAAIDRQNSDKLAPPGTDHGQTINANWPMSLSKAK